MPKNQSLRLFLYSAAAIVLMTLAWGINQTPKYERQATETLRVSLEQELQALTGATKATTESLRLKLVEALKSSPENLTSPFQAAALFEWDGLTWKSVQHFSKHKEQYQLNDIRTWMGEWPVARVLPGETHFARVLPANSQPVFAMLVPLKKGSSQMLGVGIFHASEFGLTLSADHTRELKVVDEKGHALALSRQAYLGVNLRKEPLLADILEGDEVSSRRKWEAESGDTVMGTASQVAGSNLVVALEAPVVFQRSLVWKSWFYLLLSALGAIGLNWWLFSMAIQPLLKQLTQSDKAIEALKRAVTHKHESQTSLVKPELEDYTFVESPKPAQPEAPAGEPTVALAKIIHSALKGQQDKIRSQKIDVDVTGIEGVELSGETLQIETAVEEIIKNAIEAMETADTRRLTIHARPQMGSMRLKISDTGCGVPVENRQRVFEPFFSTKDGTGISRGLGLNVVRRILEELKGSVELTSSGSGTEVELSWPQAISAHEKTPPVPQAKTEAQAADPASPKPDLALDLTEEDDFEAVIMAAPLVPSRKREFNPEAIRKPVVRTLN